MLLPLGGTVVKQILLEMLQRVSERIKMVTTMYDFSSLLDLISEILFMAVNGERNNLM